MELSLPKKMCCQKKTLDSLSWVARLPVLGGQYLEGSTCQKKTLDSLSSVLSYYCLIGFESWNSQDSVCIYYSIYVFVYYISKTQMNWFIKSLKEIDYTPEIKDSEMYASQRPISWNILVLPSKQTNKRLRCTNSSVHEILRSLDGNKPREKQNQHERNNTPRPNPSLFLHLLRTE